MSYSYWEEKYGGDEWGYGTSTGSSGGGPPSSVLDGSLVPTYSSDADRALMWCRLALSGVFVVFGIYCLLVLYRSRHVLDIHARSVRLLIMGGLSMVATYLVTVNESLFILWGEDHSLSWLWSSLLLFFVTPLIFGSYICRGLRLAVVFHPTAKRALPWLIPERNYMCVLTALAVGSLGLPIYHEYTLEVWEIIPTQTDILVTVTLVFTCAQALIFPFIRKVDDLFNISTELIVVTILLGILSVGLKVTQEFGGEAARKYIGTNLNFVVTTALFGVSVVDPLRRLAFDPLAASKRSRADRLLAHRESRSTVRLASSGVSDVEDLSGSAATADDRRRRASKTASRRLEEGLYGHDDEGDDGGDDNAVVVPTPAAVAAAVVAVASSTFAQVTMSPSPEPGAPEAGNWQYQGINFCTNRGRGAGGGDAREEGWDFERLARTPPLAAAFENFSRRALCHESVLFLNEVSRFEAGHFSVPSGHTAPSQFLAFCRIHHFFIRPGAREEVSISGVERKRISSWVTKGESSFEEEADEERRLIFRRAYEDVKLMLEDNLLRRFLQTDEFKNFRAMRRNSVPP